MTGPPRSRAGAAAGRQSTCAFIVLAHHKPEQALRLLHRLAPAPVFLHVDQGADPSVHGRLLTGTAELEWVRMLPRRRSGWASWGLVEPALAGFEAAHGVGASHVVLLSAQDYPLVPLPEIEAFCRRHEDLSFMPFWALPAQLWGRRGGMERLRYWHRPIRRRRFRIPVPRRLPPGLAPYGGAQWFMLSRRAVGDLLHFVDRRPDVVRFYRHAWTPDEMFIHTALLNSPSRERVVNENLWFVRWTPNAKHPQTLGSAEADELLAAAGCPSAVGGQARAKLFARKFDADLDPGILDALDRRALRASEPDQDSRAVRTQL